MRTLIFLIVLLITSKNNYAQLIQIQSGTTNNIYSIKSYENKVYFLGTSYFSKTYDLGNNIIQLDPPGQYDYLGSLNILDSNEMYLINAENQYHQQIIRTIDGCQNWAVLFDTTGTPINDLTVNENRNMIAVGNFGNIFKSIDGNTWETKNVSGFIVTHKCAHYGDSTFYIGGFEDVARTNDIGNTWTTRYFNTSHCSGINVISEDTVYMSSYFWNGWESFFSKSFDGGNSWETISLGSNIGIFDICFLNSSHGFAVGYNYLDSMSVVLETFDKGVTWITNTTPFNTQFNDVEVVNDSVLFIAGSNGVILRSEIPFMGINWIEYSDQDCFDINIYPNPANYLSNIAIKTSNEGDYMLSICNINGQELYENHFNLTTNITDFKKGEYFVKVTDNNKCTVIKKLIVK